MQYSLYIFLSVLAILWYIEYVFPRRNNEHRTSKHHINNISWTIINTLISRFVLQISPVLIAFWGEQQGWGLFNVWEVPEIFVWIFGLLLLDLAIYLQHVASHLIPLFWRLHQVHHLDRHIDVTTGFRFHIGEILLSFAWKAGIILLLGVPGTLVIAFEIILSTMAMFSHANIAIPPRIDRFLRYFIVTPDMHRVHHSIIRGETDSNYGFALSIWDRMFHTYVHQPEKGHENMDIGLSYQQGADDLDFSELAKVPFKSKKL